MDDLENAEQRILVLLEQRNQCDRDLEAMNEVLTDLIFRLDIEKRTRFEPKVGLIDAAISHDDLSSIVTCARQIIEIDDEIKRRMLALTTEMDAQKNEHARERGEYLRKIEAIRKRHPNALKA